MAKSDFSGVVVADTIEARFAFSGRVAGVNKKRGERVKRGDILASLDRRLLQAELDLQLAQYEKERASFEIFAKKHPDPGDDVTKFLKSGEQAQLNAAVKEVEIAKMKLDQSILASPVNGIIIDDGNNRPGLYVTPASNAFMITDLDSLRLRIEIDESDLELWNVEKEMGVKAGKLQLMGKTSLPIPSGKGWVVEVGLGNQEGLWPGMKALVESKPL